MGQKAETSWYNVHFLLTIYRMDFECPLWLHKQVTVNIYLNTAPLWQNTFEMLIFFVLKVWSYNFHVHMYGCNHFKLSSTASHKLCRCFSLHWEWTIYRDFCITNSAIGNLTISSFDHVSISRNCWGCCVCTCVHMYTFATHT